MKQNEIGVLERLAREALILGADTLEVEYRDGYEEVVAYIGALGREIARIRCGTAQASALRQDLYAAKRRQLRFSARGEEYGLRVDVYENFGEDAFRVAIRTLARGKGRSRNRAKAAPARNRLGR